MKKWFVFLCSVFFLLNGCSLNQIKSNKITETQSSSETKTDAKNVSEYATIQATVISVIDGDTIKVSINNKEEKVRFLLVDTPETVSPRVGVQPFGKKASNYTKSMLKKGTEVQIEKDVSERDKYGRLLAYVYVNGQMINKLLLKEGLARVAYVYAPNTRYVDDFKKIQEEARTEKKGIWSLEDYVHSDGFYLGIRNND
ncbi:thermonuclease family protein [Bacillus mexicanus]|uniref:thermonuclease family protein n=1 Tax=Bacillus mexicanus TaxID=2834415 RepID=UPI003D22CB53